MNNKYIIDKPAKSILICQEYFWVNWTNDEDVTFLYPENETTTLIFKNQLPNAIINIKSLGERVITSFTNPYTLKIKFEDRNTKITIYDKQDKFETVVTLKNTISCVLTFDAEGLT